MGFSRQEYWNGLTFPSPGDLPHPTDQTYISYIAGRFFTTSQQESLNTIVLVFKLLQSCPNLCDPVDCALPSSSVHGILQAKILEWVAVPFSRWSSPSKGWTWVSCIFCITGRFFIAESPGKSQLISYFTVNRNYFWASLVVQWLRIHLAKKKKNSPCSARDAGSIPGPGRSCVLLSS